MSRDQCLYKMIGEKACYWHLEAYGLGECDAGPPYEYEHFCPQWSVQECVKYQPFCGIDREEFPNRCVQGSDASVMNPYGRPGGPGGQSNVAQQNMHFWPHMQPNAQGMAQAQNMPSPGMYSNGGYNPGLYSHPALRMTNQKPNKTGYLNATLVFGIVMIISVLIGVLAVFSLTLAKTSCCRTYCLRNPEKQEVFLDALESPVSVLV